MQTYNATVEFPAPEEPFNGDYGPKYSVALRPDDQSAPKVNDGLIKIYRSPDHSSTPYMRSLRKGDRVQLVYVAKGGMSYYDFVMNGAENVQPTTHTAPVETATPTPVKKQEPQTRIYIPFSDEETETFVKIAQEQVEIILSLMKNIPDDGLGLSTEDRRAIAVTAYIQANKVYSRGMVLEELLPQLFDDESDGDDVNQDTEDASVQLFDEWFNKETGGADPNDPATIGNAFLRVASQITGKSTNQLVVINKSIGLTSDMVVFNPTRAFEILHECLSVPNKAEAEDYGKSLVQSLVSEMGGDDVPF